MKRLMQKWDLSPIRAILALIVFTLTGTTVLLIKKPLFKLFEIEHITTVWGYLLYLILILPLYNLLLLVYGSFFGLFKFFWEKEKRLFYRLIGRKTS